MLPAPVVIGRSNNALVLVFQRSFENGSKVTVYHYAKNVEIYLHHARLTIYSFSNEAHSTV